MPKAKVKIKVSKKPSKMECILPDLPDKPLDVPIKNTSSAIYQWLFLGLLCVAGYSLYRYWPELPTMNGYQVILFSLSIAFVWVNILKWGVTKPFNCVKCMTGWLALLLAILFHVEFWYLYLFAGLFVGAMFEGIRMRWL